MLPAPFRIEHLCQLPHTLARTELAVRPCIAFLHCDDDSGRTTVEQTMMPRLDAKEVAAVFSAPLHNFLKHEDESPRDTPPGSRPSDWYHGNWSAWHDGEFRLHFFYVPIHNQNVTKPRSRTPPTADDSGSITSTAAAAETAERLEDDEHAGLTRYKVWGMTARILVDAAKLAYSEEPSFEVSFACSPYSIPYLPSLDTDICNLYPS